MLSFKQFHFDPNQNFEPSKQTKDFWLYTQKSQANFAGVQLPGLFESVGYSTQIVAFVAILILEGVPTYYGIEEGVLWQGIVAAIFIDIALAICSHLWHNKICLHRNQLVIANSSVEKEKINRLIKSYKFKTYTFYLLILVSAGFKFYLFIDAYRVWNTVSVATLVCYLLGAILHIVYTGYFFYTSRFNYKIQNEYKEYVFSNGMKYGITGILEQPINTDGVNIELKSYKVGSHSITQKEDGKYYFKTYGVLLDVELAALAGVQQTSIAQSIVAREGLKHQLLILNTTLNLNTH
ncbi:MAG: hypothetical protein ACK4NY_08195 [Spirosomataceae bacterium]